MAILVAATLILITSPTIAGQKPSARRELTEYRKIVEDYRSGNLSGAANTLATYDRRRLQKVKQILVGIVGPLRQLEPRSHESGWNFQLLAVAALMHIDVTVSSPSSPGTEAEGTHLAMTRALLELLRYSKFVARSVKLQLALAVEYALHARWWLFAAREHLTETRQRLGEPPEMLLALGSLDEALASTKVDDNERRKYRLPSPEACLRTAERSYREALRVDPAMSEARVRLGRVLGQLGDDTGALEQLTRARRDASEPRLRYLALLFAGAIHDAQGRGEDAVDEFREALTLYPRAYAPVVAQVHSLHVRGELDGAKELANGMLRSPGRDAASDPWHEYDLGQAWRLNDVMAALRTELRK